MTDFSSPTNLGLKYPRPRYTRRPVKRVDPVVMEIDSTMLALYKDMVIPYLLEADSSVSSDPSRSGYGTPGVRQ